MISPHQQEAVMPLETYLAIALVVAVFGTFAGLVGWGMWYTRGA